MIYCISPEFREKYILADKSLAQAAFPCYKMVAKGVTALCLLRPELLRKQLLGVSAYVMPSDAKRRTSVAEVQPLWGFGVCAN